MKRLSSPTPSERGFPTVLDELELDDDECGEELCSGGGGGEKKRRLRVEQVRALEKNFEVENKLDPDRKVRLAHELGLQPRQVAVWFQNRRARWKTKQLERDYAALKANYDALRLDFDALQHDNQSIAAKIKEVKAKLGSGSSSEAEVNPLEIKEVKAKLGAGSSSVNEAEVNPPEIKAEMADAPILIYNKDGSSDSDSSAVINEVSSSTTFGFTPASSWSPFAAPEPRVHKGGWLGFSFQQQLMKAEEHGFLAGDEPCSSAFFSDEQPPAFTWGGPDQWCWTDGRGQE